MLLLVCPTCNKLKWKGNIPVSATALAKQQALSREAAAESLQLGAWTARYSNGEGREGDNEEQEDNNKVGVDKEDKELLEDNQREYEEESEEDKADLRRIHGSKNASKQLLSLLNDDNISSLGKEGEEEVEEDEAGGRE
jgi:hypothetical protein